MAVLGSPGSRQNQRVAFFMRHVDQGGFSIIKGCQDFTGFCVLEPGTMLPDMKFGEIPESWVVERGEDWVGGVQIAKEMVVFFGYSWDLGRFRQFEETRQIRQVVGMFEKNEKGAARFQIGLNGGLQGFRDGGFDNDEVIGGEIRFGRDGVWGLGKYGGVKELGGLESFVQVIEGALRGVVSFGLKVQNVEWSGWGWGNVECIVKLVGVSGQLKCGGCGVRFWRCGKNAGFSRFNL